MTPRMPHFTAQNNRNPNRHLKLQSAPPNACNAFELHLARQAPNAPNALHLSHLDATEAPNSPASSPIFVQVRCLGWGASVSPKNADRSPSKFDGHFAAPPCGRGGRRSRNPGPPGQPTLPRGVILTSNLRSYGRPLAKGSSR